MAVIDQRRRSAIRDKGLTLFCECLCGSAASLHELEHIISTTEDSFVVAVGTKVVTHSLSTTEYNGLAGIVTGDAVIEDGVRRLPTSLETLQGATKTLALRLDNLTTLDADGGVLDVLIKFHDHLVLKGYHGLFGLVNESPLMLPIDNISKDKFKAMLLEASALEHSGILRPDGCLHAQYLVGEWYDYGPRDAAKAVAWYRLAAEQGHAPAQCELGYAYHNGEGVEENQAEGVKFYRQAAVQGNAKAQYYVGVCFYYGQGVDAKEKGDTSSEDKEEAVRWYSLSADQGYAGAQSNLGFCYQMGLGCSSDRKRAEKYYELAAQQGDAYATARLSRLTDFDEATRSQMETLSVAT